MLTSGLNLSSEEFHDALEGLQEAWESYFEDLGPIIKGKKYKLETKTIDDKEVEIDHDTELPDGIL